VFEFEQKMRMSDDTILFINEKKALWKLK